MTEFQALVILISRVWMLNDKNIDIFRCTLDNLNSIQRYYSIHKVVLYLLNQPVMIHSPLRHISRAESAVLINVICLHIYTPELDLQSIFRWSEHIISLVGVLSVKVLRTKPAWTERHAFWFDSITPRFLLESTLQYFFSNSEFE